MKLNGLLTAESKCKSVARIRAAMCYVAIRIPCLDWIDRAWDEHSRVARPLTRVLNQGTVIVDDNSLPSERCLSSDFDDSIVYGCGIRDFRNVDCVPAIRKCRCREPLSIVVVMGWCKGFSDVIDLNCGCWRV